MYATHLVSFRIEENIGDETNPNWVHRDIADGLTNYTLQEVNEESYFVYDQANRLTELTIVKYRGVTHALNETVYIDYYYDALGNLYESFRRFDSDDYDNEQFWLFFVGDNGDRKLTFKTATADDFQITHPNQLAGVSLLDAQGNTLLVHATEQTGTGQNATYNWVDYAWIFNDRQGTPRNVVKESGPSSESSYEIRYTTGGQPDVSRVPELEGNANLNEIISFFAGYQYDPEIIIDVDGVGGEPPFHIGSGLYLMMDGRAFSPFSESFLSESRDAMFSGASNLYQRSALGPSGTIRADYPGVNYFSEDSGIPSFWEAAAQPIFAYAQVLGGGVSVITGVMAAPFTGGASLLVTAKGVDDIIAGSRTLLTGKHTETFTFNAVNAVTGDSTLARITDIGTSLIAPTGATVNALGKGVSALSNISRVSRSSRALSTGAALAKSQKAAKLTDVAEVTARATRVELPVIQPNCFVAGTKILVVGNEEAPVAYIAADYDRKHSHITSAIVAIGLGVAAWSAGTVIVENRNQRKDDDLFDAGRIKTGRNVDPDQDWAFV